LLLHLALQTLVAVVEEAQALRLLAQEDQALLSWLI
jgi:hypothetical protein